MQINPIAHIHSPFKEKFGIPRQSGLTSIVSTIVFEAEFRDENALRGLEGFSHLWLIWGFSENEDDKTFHPTVRPPRLGGEKRMGVFATRSPFRPNALGLSCVQIKGIRSTKEGSVIEVIGADLMDNTPIYDIKPYLVQFDCKPEATEGFVGENEYRTLDVVIPDYVAQTLSEDMKASLFQILRQDPRPHYQDDSKRIYGLSFGSLNVRFRVSENTLTVVEIK